MGKSKKKKRSNDSRGYQQGNDRPLPAASNRRRTTTTTTSNSTLSTTAHDQPETIQITHSLHEQLEHVLEVLKTNCPEAMTEYDEYYDNQETNEIPDPRRLRKRLGNVLDTLTQQYGFSVSQVQQVVTALPATHITTEKALDWLCVHLSTAELPPLFTEGLVRDGANAQSVHVEVVVAPVRREQHTRNSAAVEDTAFVVNSTSHDTKTNKETTSSNNEELCSRPRQTQATDTMDQDQEFRETQKKWLLQQYQYESDDDAVIDDTQEEEQLVKDSSERQQQQLAQDADTQPSHHDSPKALPSPQEQLLEDARRQLEELENDLKDEAANYMRSKYEIKQMQSQAKQLRKQVKGLEGKVAKMRAEEEAAKAAAEADNNEAEAEEEAAFGGGLFGSHSEDGEEDEQITNGVEVVPDTQRVTEMRMQLFLPADTVPKSWTGQTPKSILEERCRKEKLPRPSYSKLGQNGCELRLRLSGGQQLVVRQDKRAERYLDSQHYASTRALYEMNPELSLDHLLPPYYRDLWQQWVRDVQVKRQEELQEIHDHREKLIDELARLAIADNRDQTRSGQARHPAHHKPDAKTGIGKEKASRPGSTFSHDDDVKISNQFKRRQSSSKYKDMLKIRERLPVYSFRREILETISNNPVTIISAETGAGKTTQVPQFILADALESPDTKGISVVCTQPRRVAATSIADRVADEMCEQGGVGGLVGYQIRLESKRSSQTRLLFCTTGIILRRLSEDPELSGVTHVIVDEVHERQWQIDLLLAALRQLLQGPRRDLKVVLMSATVDIDLFSTYFGNAPVLSVPGRSFPVGHYYLEDLLETTGHVIEAGSRYALRRRNYADTISLSVTTRGGEKRKETEFLPSDSDDQLSDDFVGYSLPTRRSLDRVNETVINYDLIEDVLVKLCTDPDLFLAPASEKVTDGAVLIFLPGIGEIRTLTDALRSHRLLGNRNQFDIIPLHSTVSSAQQKRAFQPSPPGVRKIIPTTNIAETSITIPDVTCVIDSGRMREIQRDKRTGTQKLVQVWCSQANAKQRAGRAGRVQTGICLKLFSSKTEQSMAKNPEPELRRIPLDEICLTVLGSGLTKSCKEFLSMTPESPPDAATTVALETLRTIGAVDVAEAPGSAERLTPLGEHLVRLPIDARLGKILIYGSIFKCLSSALTLAAALSASKSPFATASESTGKEKHAVFSHDTSDFCVLLNAWAEFEKVKDSPHLARQFCSKHHLNYQSFQEIADARKHFLDLLCDIGFVRFGNANDWKSVLDSQLSFYCLHDGVEGAVNAVLCAGLYPNIASLRGENTTITIWQRAEQLTIRPDSVNAKLPKSLPSKWMVFHEKLSTGRATSISKTCFVHPFCVAIFGASLQIKHAGRKIVVDDWIEMGLAAKTGVIIREIRHVVDFILKRHVQSTSDSKPWIAGPEGSAVIENIIDLMKRAAK